MIAHPLLSSSPISFHARINYPTGLKRAASKLAACKSLLLESKIPVILKSATAVGKYIKPLPDAALCRSTLIHHTPDSYTKTRTTLFLLYTKSCIVWRKIGVWCSSCWKFIKRKSLKLLVVSRSFRLCYLKIGNLLLNWLHRGDRSKKAHKWLYFPL